MLTPQAYREYKAKLNLCQFGVTSPHDPGFHRLKTTLSVRTERSARALLRDAQAPLALTAPSTPPAGLEVGIAISVVARGQPCAAAVATFLASFTKLAVHISSRHPLYGLPILQSYYRAAGMPAAVEGIQDCHKLNPGGTMMNDGDLLKWFAREAKRRQKGELEDPIKLSPSTMNIYFDCQRCLWFKGRGYSRPSIPVAGITHGFDACAKELFDRHRRDGTLPAVLQDLEGGRLFPERPKNLTWVDPASGCVLGGKLDDAVIDQWGVAPLDYKTCKRPFDTVRESVMNQLDCYALLLGTIPGVAKVSPYAYVLYIYPQLEGPVLGNVIDRKDGEFRLGVASKLVRVEIDADRAWTMMWLVSKVIRGPMPPAEPDCDFCAWRRLEDG